MPTIKCEHGSAAPLEVLDQIEALQNQKGQPKCVVCAYQRGYEWGVQNKFMLTGDVWDFPICKHGSRALLKVMAELPDVPAGTSPDKCPTCAYQRGFEAARVAANAGGPG